MGGRTSGKATTDSSKARHGLSQRDNSQAIGVDIKSSNTVVTKASLKVRLSARMSVGERNKIVSLNVCLPD